MSGAGQARTALATALPKAFAGLERLEAAAAGDGTLGPGVRPLITAAAAAARRQDRLARAKLAEAHAAGLPAEYAWAAAGLLVISRGVEAGVRLAETLLDLFGPPAAGPGYDGAYTQEGAHAYFLDYFGEIPPRIAFFEEQAPAALAGYALLHQALLRESALPPKLVELLLCGVNAADFQSGYVAIHGAAALRAGATRAELVEAVVAVLPVSGAAAWAGSAGVLEEL